MKTLSNVAVVATILLLPFLVAVAESGAEVTFLPVEHASLVIQSPECVIYVDPVGGGERYAQLPAPDIILITHTHGDHLNAETLAAVKQQNSVVAGPKAVIDQLQYGEIMNNGDTKTWHNAGIEAVPMYNLTEGRLQFHKKGQGNGYVITLEGKRIYISGDTEDIPEMRSLRNIDDAFICMNLPYTMTVEQAASAVLEMKPKRVYPYHYRGQGGMSDLQKFKDLVSKDKDIAVVLLDWYK